VIRDEKNNRWVCFFAEHFICMAVSGDQHGRPGTWIKLYNGQFNEPGLKGRNSPVAGSQNHPGGNPSVHFNSYLQRWVMVWHTWDDRGLWLSFSNDLLQWATPQLIVTTGSGERVWYGSIIGETDQIVGQNAWISYSRFPYRNSPPRNFVRRKLQFW
jgi:hypothetical protein